MRYYHTFHNYRIFFSLNQYPLLWVSFVHVLIVAVQQINIILYYFSQPLLSVYNITLLTAKMIYRLTNTITDSQINYSHIQFTIILNKNKHYNQIFTQTVKYGAEKKHQRKIISALGFERDNKYLKLGRLGWRLERPAAVVGRLYQYLPVSLSLSLSSVSIFSFFFFFSFSFFNLELG